MGAQSCAAGVAAIPPAIAACGADGDLNYSRTMLEEIFRIEQRRRVDAVEAVSWDCEGRPLHWMKRSLAINVVTSFASYLSMHPQQQNDELYMEEFGLPMLELEDLIFTSSQRSLRQPKYR